MMQKGRSLVINFIFFLHGLLLFFLIMGDKAVLPAWVQVIGRVHPAIIHLPIGLFVFMAFLHLTRSWWTSAYEELIDPLMLITSVTAALAAVMGFFLSLQGDYGSSDLFLHKYGGSLFSLGCYLLLIFRNVLDSRPQATRATMLVLSAAVVFAGHTGSVLTHGKNYMLAPLISSRAADEGPKTAYAMVVEPVLSKKCFSCHNATKAKGGLVMTSEASFVAGGKKGPEWKAGNPAESRLVQYIHLPETDDHHMPPEGKTQLTADEKLLLEAWIRSGADFKKLLTDIPETDTFRLISARRPSPMTEVVASHYDFPPVSPDEIARLNTPFRTVSLINQGSPALRTDFYVRQAFQSRSLEELSNVDRQVVELNLANMPVTDKELALVTRFQNLEMLNLNFTGVTAAGIATLQSLKKLKSLSLCSTPVDGETVRLLLKSPQLNRVYLWNTKVNEAEIAAIARDFPQVKLFEGPPAESGKVMKLGIPSLVRDEVLPANEQWELKHTMPGVQIRYTLDGTTPDSVKGQVYDKPFVLKNTSRLKAIACKPGWYCSAVMEKICFVKGLPVAAVKLLTPPDKKYPGEGPTSLVDGRKGFTDVFNEPSWLAFQKNPMEAEFSFSGQTPINQVVISIGFSTGGHIFLPEEVEVWGTTGTGGMKLLKKERLPQPTKDVPTRMEYLVFPIPSAPYSKVKLKVIPVPKLPVWKSKKRDPGWVFVDEVFFY